MWWQNEYTRRETWIGYPTSRFQLMMIYIVVRTISDRAWPLEYNNDPHVMAGYTSMSMILCASVSTWTQTLIPWRVAWISLVYWDKCNKSFVPTCIDNTTKNVHTRKFLEGSAPIETLLWPKRVLAAAKVPDEIERAPETKAVDSRPAVVK